MKIMFLGTGSAFTMKNWQTNTLIEEGGKYLLLDCGGDIRWALASKGLSYKDMDAIYISHLHGDHIGGVEYHAFCNYFDPSCEEKIQLIGNGDVVREAWTSSLRGGLKSIQGKEVLLQDYFDLQQVRKNGKIVWQDITIELIQTIHIMDGNSFVYSYGLMITNKHGYKIFYTGDSQFAPDQLPTFYDKADLIIQDCETYPFKSGVHANYEDLATLTPDIKSKMLLQHYNDNILVDGLTLLDSPKEPIPLKKEWEERVQKDGFHEIGFIPRGYELEVGKM